MLSVFLSQLLILYHLLGHVLTAPPPRYLKKCDPRSVTMKGNFMVCVQWKLPLGRLRARSHQPASQAKAGPSCRVMADAHPA